MTILWINIATLIWLTTLTGAIMVVLWYGIGLILERLGFVNIVFELLKMVALFFYLPIAFIGLKVYTVEVSVGLFSPTPTIFNLCRIFVIVWSIGVLIAMGVVVYNFILIFLSNKKLFECEQDLQELFEQIKAELHMEHTKLQLRQSYHTQVPYVEGSPTPVIVLPVANFTPQELRVIFIHEMMHYKQKDLFLKLVTYVLLAFHYFNPFAWMLFVKIQKWSEFACDYRAAVYAGGIKPYFQVIMNIVMENPLKSGLTSQMAYSQHQLKQRVEKQVRISKMKNRSGACAVLVLCTAFLLSSTTVYAATVDCANAYMKAEQKTAVADVESENNYVTGDEHTEYGDANRVTCVAGEVEEDLLRGATAFNWDVPIGYRIYGPWFDCTEGETILVSALIDPLYVTLRVGIEDEQGYRYYVEDTDTISHSFTARHDRKYRVYVQNDTGTDAYISGSYITRGE